MSNQKSYDIASIVVSLVLGVLFAVLIHFFPTLYRTGYIFAAALAGGALLLQTITASSLLRQDRRLNDCICATGSRLLIPAIILLAFSLPSMLIGTLSLRVNITYPIFSFVLYALMSYVFFSLYSFLDCLINAGCSCRCQNCEE